MDMITLAHNLKLANMLWQSKRDQLKGAKGQCCKLKGAKIQTIAMEGAKVQRFKLKGAKLADECIDTFR